MRAVQRYLLYFYIFSINFEMWDPFGTGIDFLLTKISAVLYILFTLFDFKSLYSIKHIKKYIYPIVAFFCLLTCMNFLNRSKDNLIFFNVPFFLNIVIMLAAINQSKRDRHLLLKCLFVFALSTIILTILYLFSIQTDNTWENRITIFRNNQNELGLKIAISILILITIMHDNRLKFKKNRYLFYVIILAMLIFMIQTGSRVAFISLFLSLITYFFLRGKNFTLNNLYKLLPVSIIFLFIWQFFLVNTLLIKRIFMTVNEGDISGRDIRWVASLDLISKNPLFGQGETGYARSIVPILDYYSSPHNVMIEILCYTGIVGLIIFLIFLTRTIICGINSYKVDKDIFPVTLLIPIFGMILSGQIIGTKIAWVIFTFIIALPVSKSFNNRLKRRKERILINNNHETLNGEF